MALEAVEVVDGAWGLRLGWSCAAGFSAEWRLGSDDGVDVCETARGEMSVASVLAGGADLISGRGRCAVESCPLTWRVSAPALASVLGPSPAYSEDADLRNWGA